MAVTSRYKVKKLGTDLIKSMLTKVNSTAFAAMILNHMEDAGNTDDLKELCKKMGRSSIWQRQMGSQTKAMTTEERKCSWLALKTEEHSVESVENARLDVDTIEITI